MKILLLPMLLCLSLLTHAQVAIGVAVPHPSAELDVTATNRGFLPPRVTKAQRDSIVTPATGLMIFCTNCTPKGDPQFYDGTRWNSMNAAPVVHTIGESYGGGIVFFVTPNGLHGLIAETVDQSQGCDWRDAQDVISINANHSSAGKEFTDWRLPTKNELSLMYLQNAKIGGFANTFYWSSTELNDFYKAWVQLFDNRGLSQYATSNYDYKVNPTIFVRAVRSF